MSSNKGRIKEPHVECVICSKKMWFHGDHIVEMNNHYCTFKCYQNKRYKLKKTDWDNREACKDEAVRLGLTSRMGYHAWCAGQGCGGYESVIGFFDDIFTLLDYFLRTRESKEHVKK